jgi:hypothetical protein
MIRGTTPIHTFVLPLDESVIDKVRVIYSQDDKPVLIKDKENCAMKGQNLVVALTQEDTFAFDCDKHVEIQIRVLTVEGNAVASHIKTVDCGRCLENEVL